MLPKAEILLTEANGYFWREGLGKKWEAKNKKEGVTWSINLDKLISPAFTSCPHQSPAPAALSPLSHFYFQQRKQALCWRLEFATQHLHFHHFLM